jgi:hypothetical protein
VESPYGGYGLYRTPMIEFDLVARAGTMLGDKPISIDVLRQGERAIRVAREFKSAIQNTDYYRRAAFR